MPSSRLLSPSRPLCLFALTAFLAACGGGGGGGDDQAAQAPGGGTVAPPAPQQQDTGGVSAPFVAQTAANPGYFMQGAGAQIVGRLDTFTQTASGAMTALNDTRLTGSPAVTQDIGGDAFYALGRWTLGTATSGTGTTVLAGNNAAAHYVAFNRLATLPTSGTFACNGGSFTAPTYIGGASVQPADYTGTATGSATLTFTSAGAVVSGSYRVQAGSAFETGTLELTVATPTSTALNGGYFGGNSGSVVGIGDGGNGTYLVVISYTSLLSNGTRYQGVAALRCGA